MIYFERIHDPECPNPLKNNYKGKLPKRLGRILQLIRRPFCDHKWEFYGACLWLCSKCGKRDRG